MNLNLQKGITALIGPNGAGKSTFLKLILGLIKPTEGSLKIFGLDSWNDSALLHEKIGVIHEKHHFPDHLSVQRYLDIISYFFTTVDDLNFRSIINFPLDRRISSLSAGMFRKFSLFISFLGNPKLIIMDEPTANLDPIARKELLEIIKDIHERFKIDFIISSHILSDLENIASNVIVLNKGEVIFQGKYSNLLHQYFSNKFEIFVDDIDEWMNYFNSNNIFKKIQNHHNKIILTTQNEMDSNKLLSSIFKSENAPKSNINLFRKVLDIEELFKK
jgi:ABC-2 type transport system ATP-binding protein